MTSKDFEKFFKEGNKFAELRHFEKAIKSFKKAVKLDPNKAVKLDPNKADDVPYFIRI